MGRKIVKGKCSWCGEEFTKKHNKEAYCSEKCRKKARKLQNRNRALRWYHRHKHERSEDQKFGLGSGWIRGKRNTDFERERKIVQNEKKRLGLE